MLEHSGTPAPTLTTSPAREGGGYAPPHKWKFLCFIAFLSFSIFLNFWPKTFYRNMLEHAGTPAPTLISIINCDKMTSHLKLQQGKIPYSSRGLFHYASMLGVNLLRDDWILDTTFFAIKKFCGYSPRRGVPVRTPWLLGGGSLFREATWVNRCGTIVIPRGGGVCGGPQKWPRVSFGGLIFQRRGVWKHTVGFWWGDFSNSDGIFMSKSEFSVINM